jgi:hypothetical protein
MLHQDAGQIASFLDAEVNNSGNDSLCVHVALGYSISILNVHGILCVLAPFSFAVLYFTICLSVHVAPLHEP